MTKFRDLKIGETFDWMGPNQMHNSFFKCCRKISDRKYVAVLPTGDMSNEGPMSVGTINAKVYHVGRSYLIEAA
jgi:hypothetical protein